MHHHPMNQGQPAPRVMFCALNRNSGGPRSKAFACLEMLQKLIEQAIHESQLNGANHRAKEGTV